jgi:prohibitin 2
MIKDNVFFKLGVKVFVGILAFATLYGSFYVIGPGERGIVVTMGKVSSTFSSEGLGFKLPFISDVVRVSVRQQTEGLQAQAFSSDLQTVGVTVKVLYKIPEAQVIPIYQQYAGNPFESLIAPRIQEALKEVTALESAESIAKKRETVKAKTLDLARKKIGDTLFIEDVVIENLDLSNELENAIEQKMVQEQEAAKAKFIKEKALIEAETAVVVAEGEAKAIKKRGDAIKENPGVIQLMIAEKWNGVSPLVVGGSGNNSNLLLPLSSSK